MYKRQGENVATFEIANAISRFPGVDDVNVYGVEIPRHDGRAGMATIVAAADGLDLKALADHIAGSLPEYARPVILRLSREIEMTSTLKHRKTTLMQEGFDPAMIDDALYYADPQARTYRPLDDRDYARICNGEIRF